MKIQDYINNFSAITGAKKINEDDDYITFDNGVAISKNSGTMFLQGVNIGPDILKQYHNGTMYVHNMLKHSGNDNDMRQQWRDARNNYSVGIKARTPNMSEPKLNNILDTKFGSEKYLEKRLRERNQKEDILKNEFQAK